MPGYFTHLGLRGAGRKSGFAIALLLSACAVGPNFHAPAPPATQGYAPGELPKSTVATGVVGGEAQRFLAGQELPGEWWTLFGSAALDQLIAQAMANYPDIAAQQAALLQARENVRAEAGVFVPSLTGSGFADREKTSGGAIAPGFPGFITNIFQAQVNVSYTFDLFGGERRTLEQLQAQAEAQNFQLEASYLTLTSNVAAAAIQLAATRDLLDATHQIIELEEKQLTVIQRRVQLGSQTSADVLQQQSNLASVRATLPPLQQQLAVTEHQLAVLTGRFPHDVTAPELKLADLKLPQDLPVSLPSALVAQRLLNGSRRMRIANGAGVKVVDVNQLLKQFQQMQKMMKMMKGGGAKKLMRQMEAMRGRGGPPGFGG